MKIGEKAVDFKLKGVDGRDHSLGEFLTKDILVIFFTCNHCPYAQAYEDRLVKLQRDYQDKGVQFIAINSNDDKNYPEDSFEKMKERAREKGFNFPYLRDSDQNVARGYNAACTPEIYLFDQERKLQYHGKVDDNWKDPTAVTRQYVREAIDALLSDYGISEPEIPAIGCSIKWSK